MKLKGNINKLEYATLESAGFDFRSTRDVVLPPGDWYAIPTGVYVESGEPDEYIAVVPRSGLAYNYGVTVLDGKTFVECPDCGHVFSLKDESVLNNPGTIDVDYPDEIKVMLINLSDEPLGISVGDRIAQGILRRKGQVENIKVSDEKRTGGFGSTGIK